MIEMRINSYTPDKVSPPGETLRDILDERQMSQAEFAERCGRPKKTICEIISGKTAITPETAIQFETVLGVPASFWNSREMLFQTYLAAKKEDENLKKYKDWASNFPCAELIKLGWIKDVGRNAVDRIKELLRFFAVASPEQWESTKLPINRQTNFRKSAKLNADEHAISAWLRKGDIDAQAIQARPYNKDGFKSALNEIRELVTCSSPSEFIPRITKLCAENGVAFVITKNLPGVPVSGATRWLSPTKAILQLSVRFLTEDHFWFSFFHEAAHILLHGKRDPMIDWVSSKDPTDQIERQADRFASDFLINSEKWLKWIASASSFSESEIINFAKSEKVSPGIVLGRLQHEKKIRHDSIMNRIKTRYHWNETQNEN